MLRTIVMIKNINDIHKNINDNFVMGKSVGRMQGLYRLLGR